MREISKKYFIKDKRRNTFCIMLFIMLMLLSVTSLLISFYEYKIEVMMNSHYFTISDNERILSKRDDIEIISCDEKYSCYTRVSKEKYENFITFLNDEEFGYIEQDVSNDILNYIKMKPIVIVAVILCLIFELLIAIAIIWRKFKKEEVMRTNLNNIGANKMTLIKLDSVYVWVFICCWLLCNILISLGVSMFKLSDYLFYNRIYVYGSISVIHLVLFVIYFMLLYINIRKIKKRK